jgi:pyrimidine operon attenuation protein/uracil phosphoribosyltransferase
MRSVLRSPGFVTQGTISLEGKQIILLFDVLILGRAERPILCHADDLMRTSGVKMEV